MGSFRLDDVPSLGPYNNNRGSFKRGSSFTRSSFNRGSSRRLSFGRGSSRSFRLDDIPMDDADLDKDLEECFKQVLAEENNASSSMFDDNLNQISMTKPTVRSCHRNAHTSESAPRSRAVSAVAKKSSMSLALKSLSTRFKNAGKSTKRLFTKRSRIEQDNLELKFRIKSMQLLKKAMIRRHGQTALGN